MFDVTKRRKVDASPATSAPQAYDRSLQLQPRYNSTTRSNPSVHSMAQPQLHQQQLRLGVGVVPGRHGAPTHLHQQQLGSHGHRHHPSNGRVVPRTNDGSTPPQVDRFQGRCQSGGNKRQHEQSRSQHPPMTATLSPSSPPFSISSPGFTSRPPVVTSSSFSPATTMHGPFSLPGMSTMLQMPSNCNASTAATRGSVGDTTDDSLSVHSPTLIQQRGNSNNMFSALYKWGSEMTSISPIKTNTTANCFKSFNGPEHFATPTASGAPGERIANPNKNSRYLREMDRREILSRIEQGEKQATLAKEYQVSRAAICSLNKHREDVMLRKDANPLAKHPKKLRPKSLKLKISSSSSSKAARGKLSSPRLNGTGGSGKGNNTHEIKSRAAALLLMSLRNKNTTMSEFRRSSERLVRLVLEEALAFVPIKAVEVLLSDFVKANGVGWENPPCAVSMESQEKMEGGSPLLDQFRALEPDQPIARARIVKELDYHHSEEEQPKTQQANLVDTHLFPASLKYHNVFVFDVSATCSDAICAVVQTLQERGAVEAMIYLVVLFIDSEVIASVHKKYPDVKIVAAQIDPSGKTPLTPSGPVVDSSDHGAGATSSGVATSSAARPECCMEFVLNHLCEVYSN